MYGIKALPYIGDLARKADATVPYVTSALNVVPLLAPDYGESHMAICDSFGTVSLGCKAAPHDANAATSIATKVHNLLPCDSFGD